MPETNAAIAAPLAPIRPRKPNLTGFSPMSEAAPTVVVEMPKLEIVAGTDVGKGPGRGSIAVVEVEADRQVPQPKPCGGHFLPLGHDDGRYFFIENGGGQVRSFGGNAFGSIATFLELAPMSYWEEEFPTKGGFSTAAATDALVSACKRVGIYDPDRIRGRGAYLDGRTTILHLGDRVFVNGIQKSPQEISGGRWIYPHARRLNVTVGEPLTSEQSAKLIDVCRHLPISNPQGNGLLLAGWLVAALVPGAMPHRPTAYLTGEAGAGKTWSLDNVIRPVLNGAILYVQGETTAAGIRQELGSDSISVVFDEAETQSQASRQRMQQVLNLVRQSYSDNGASTLKGTSSGKSMAFSIRSCFMFSSINLAVQQAADVSRTIVIDFGTHHEAQVRLASFDTLKKVYADAFIDDFGPKLMGRVLKLLPTLVANAKALSLAFARAGHSSRLGDTIGTALAGAWLLQSDAEMSPEDADKFITMDGIGVAASAARIDPEWKQSLAHLAMRQIRFENAGGRPTTTTLGELVAWSDGREVYGEGHLPPTVKTALARCGMRVKDGRLYIANKTPFVCEAFADTAWGAAWEATLLRTPDAKKEPPIKIGVVATRALSLPVDVFLGGDMPVDAPAPTSYGTLTLKYLDPSWEQQCARGRKLTAEMKVKVEAEGAAAVH